MIELLTVIAIIGILASILIPVVGRVREAGRISACAAQLRDLGLAVHLYAEERNDWIPANFGDGDPEQISTEWGSYAPDRGPGLLLSPEKGGATVGDSYWEGDYLDNAHQLFCPYSDPELFTDPEYIHPDNIYQPGGERLIRMGYMWVYQEAGSDRDNSKITVQDVGNRPYMFDFLAPNTSTFAANFTVNPHQNRANVWHVGGHVTSVNLDEVRERATDWNSIYDFFTFRNWENTH